MIQEKQLLPLQVSIGYFLTDLTMMLLYFPSLGGKEYVSITLS
jgi:hypothetical protein